MLKMAEASSPRAQFHRSPRSFAERTLNGITDALEQTLFAEEIAHRPGLLQSLDPRCKLIGGFVLLVAISASHNLIVIFILYTLTLPIAYLSSIPLDFYFKRVWVFMPFFTGIVALPALFSPFTPGTPLITLIDQASPHIYLAITQPGVITAAFLLLRVGASVSIAVLLVLTTRWTVLLKALRVLRVPQVFVLVLGMTFRYIFLLLHTVNNMFLARQSRLAGRAVHEDDRKWLAAAMGVLVSKSYALSEEVYLAMQSRGFSGEARVMETLQWHRSDGVWMIGFMMIAATAIWLGR
jgi:cobalt/nickel transport system permease protein